MGMSKALGMYADVAQIFDTCLKQGALTLTFPTPAQAAQFRMRAYYYRKLLHQKQLEALGVAVAATSTPYDAIKMQIPTDAKNTVRVSQVSVAAIITLDSGETPEIAPVAHPTSPAEENDPLLAEALRLALDLGS